MSSRTDAEWIVFCAKQQRSMWPLEACEWVAEQLRVPAPDGGSSVTWLALTLERRTDRQGTVKRLLAALEDAPEGTFTEADQVAEHRDQAREFDKWSTDQAEGLGRREGHQQ